jgi:hypothetical protein
MGCRAPRPHCVTTHFFCTSLARVPITNGHQKKHCLFKTLHLRYLQTGSKQAGIVTQMSEPFGKSIQPRLCVSGPSMRKMLPMNCQGHQAIGSMLVASGCPATSLNESVLPKPKPSIQKHDSLQYVM